MAQRIVIFVAIAGYDDSPHELRVNGRRASVFTTTFTHAAQCSWTYLLSRSLSTLDAPRHLKACIACRLHYCILSKSDMFSGRDLWDSHRLGVCRAILLLVFRRARREFSPVSYSSCMEASPATIRLFSPASDQPCSGGSQEIKELARSDRISTKISCTCRRGCVHVRVGFGVRDG